MCLIKCNLINDSLLQIEANDSIFFVKGDCYNGEFYAYPEELARIGIDEKDYLDYVKTHPNLLKVK